MYVKAVMPYNVTVTESCDVTPTLKGPRWLSSLTGRHTTVCTIQVTQENGPCLALYQCAVKAETLTLKTSHSSLHTRPGLDTVSRPRRGPARLHTRGLSKLSVLLQTCIASAI